MRDEGVYVLEKMIVTGCGFTMYTVLTTWMELCSNGLQVSNAILNENHNRF